MNNALEQLKTLLATGSEDQVMDFIAEHFAEFPEETQQKLAAELLRDALVEENKERATIVALKEEAVEMIRALEQK